MSNVEHDLRDHWDQLAYEPRDVSTCATEPIQFCGAIQADGYFLRCNHNSRLIDAASINCVALFGVATISDVLGQDLFTFLTPDVPGVSTMTNAEEMSAAGAILVRNLRGEGTFRASFYREGDEVYVDVEPTQPPDDQASVRYVDELRKLVYQVDTEHEMESFLARGATQVRKLTGYDRVMIYRFEPNWDGVVVAEDRAPQLESWLGLCYPETDIPNPRANCSWTRVTA